MQEHLGIPNISLHPIGGNGIPIGFRKDVLHGQLFPGPVRLSCLRQVLFGVPPSRSPARNRPIAFWLRTQAGRGYSRQRRHGTFSSHDLDKITEDGATPILTGWVAVHGGRRWVSATRTRRGPQEETGGKCGG